MTATVTTFKQPRLAKLTALMIITMISRVRTGATVSSWRSL
jgi:hypothetical protein